MPLHPASTPAAEISPAVIQSPPESAVLPPHQSPCPQSCVHLSHVSQNAEVTPIFTLLLLRLYWSDCGHEEIILEAASHASTRSGCALSHPHRRALASPSRRRPADPRTHSIRQAPLAHPRLQHPSRWCQPARIRKGPQPRLHGMGHPRKRPRKSPPFSIRPRRRRFPTHSTKT